MPLVTASEVHLLILIDACCDFIRRLGDVVLTMDGDLYALNSQLLRAEMSKPQISISPNVKNTNYQPPPQLYAPDQDEKHRY